MSAAENARAILESCSHNDWDGSDTAETIAAARYAVVVERFDESWVRAANTADDVAGIEMACHFGTEGYDEWIEDVYSVETGESVEFSPSWTLTLTIDGSTAEVSA